MKNKYLKIIVTFVFLFSLTGCTKYIKDENKQIIKNETTGQNLPLNILCKPTDSETLKIYENYNETTENTKVDLENLPTCKSMPIKSKNYEGLWVTIFVQPLAWIIIKLGNLVKNYGLAVILCTLLIRGICYPFTKNTAMQSEKIKQAQPKLDKLEKKYQNKTDQESMMLKSQEMMLIYKEYNINPMSSCLFSFIQIPLFFAFYEAITRIPVIFEESFLGLQLGTSPYVAIFQQGNFLYIILIILVILATYFSFKLNSGASMNKEQAEQMKLMSNMMIVMMAITAFSISSGIAIYWITSNIFTIIQNLLVKRSANHGRN
jgi:YidC/Oxa1 family membrane protein insertase